MAKLWTRSWQAIWKEATRSKQMSHIIGIDFESTNTTVAYADDDKIIKS